MIHVRKVLKKSWNFLVLETGLTSCFQVSVIEYSLTSRYLYKGDKIPVVAYFLEIDSNANNRFCNPENFDNFCIISFWRKSLNTIILALTTLRWVRKKLKYTVTI